MILSRVLPHHPAVPFDVVNKLMTKKEISAMIDTVYRNCGQKETVIFCDRIMALGFYHAFKAGISFGKDDMVVPENKWSIVEETRALAKDYEQQYQDGLITQGEKYNKVVDAWAKCSDRLAAEMMNRISSVKKDETGRDKPVNSIYMMSHSGARGSPAQMKQLAAMRGLMAKPSGEIIESPIISNFKEGLDVLEYFNSTHGARKGLADTALKTANSGYLTRRLVDVAQDAVIREPDCGTERGIKMRAIIDAGQVVASLASRILGRSTAEDLVDADGTVIVPAGTMIEEQHIEAITAAGIQEVKIRSVLVCESKNGVCATCYGRDLARGTPVNMGEAVGVIAAQSIGEPGTQLTMRTFHIGGAAQIADQSFIESNFEGTVRMRNRNVARNSDGELIAMGRNVAVVIVGPDGVERAVHRLQYGARLKVDEGDTIKRGQRIAEWDPYTRPILTEVDGTVAYEDLVDGQSMTETDGRVDRHREARRDRLARLEPAPRTFARRSSSTTRTTRSPSSRAAARRAGSCRSTPSSRSIRAPRSRPATCSPASRPRAPRPATSRAACRAWRSCSRRAGRRTRRSSRRSRGRSSSGATTRTSAA